MVEVSGPANAPVATCDAVVLAGGRGTRLGGVDKAAILLNGERMVDRVVAAARDIGAIRVVVVGPETAQSHDTILVREDPPFTGPLAALGAALPEVQAETLLLLSCDLVRPHEVCRILATQPISDGFDGVVLRDLDLRPQWLAGVYRVAALRAGAARLGTSLDHASLRALLGDLRLEWLDAPPRVTADIDENDDLERARSALERGSTALESVSAPGPVSARHENEDSHG